MSERHYLFLLTGSRKDGNSETLARRAAAALPDDAQQSWLCLQDLPLPSFVDIRHSGDGIYPRPQGHAATLLDATLAATDLVFVAPLYWYSLPTAAKLYLDHWSGWMRVLGVDFKPRMAGKTLWAISVHSDEDDPSVATPLFETLRLTAAYMKMTWGGSLLGFGNFPGDVLKDDKALNDAREFFNLTLAGTA